MKRLIISSLIILSCIISAKAIGTDSIPGKKKIGNFYIHASLNTSRIVPTNSFLRSTGDNAASVAPDLRASFKFSPESAFGRMYPGVTQGIGVRGDIILPKSTLGYPVSVYLFQDVKLCTFRRFWLSAEWNFGLSAGWRHFNAETNPANIALGSNVNAMLGIGISATYSLNPAWGLRATLNAVHYSNGNTRLPNAGVNAIGIMLGAIYNIDRLSDVQRHYKDVSFNRGFEYDLAVYGATRRRIVLDSSETYIVAPGSFGVAGINFAPMYAVNRYFRAGISADLQYDESANIGSHLVDGTYGDMVKFYRQSFAERFSGGLSLRAELTLPIFSVNVGIGRNFIARGPDTRIFYQTLTLKAHVWRNAFIQAGYQLSEFHLPNNLMLGIGYTFNRRN